MATETTRQIVQENPEIEAYRLGLLQDVQRFIGGQITGQVPVIDPRTGQPRKNPDGSVSVYDKSGNNGSDTLSNIEVLKFTDGAVSLQTDP